MAEVADKETVTGNTNEKDSLPRLSVETIKGLEDVLEGMLLAEEHELVINGLDSLEEIQTRLKCHLTFLTEGNLKEKIDAQIQDLGSKDVQKKDQLSELITGVKDIFPKDQHKRTNRRLELLETLLNEDGTTANIRQDCDLRIASLKEKECVILVSGESSAGKSSLLNLLLGEEILPSHMLPCTSCITVIKYDSKRHAKVLYKNGETMSISELDKEGLELLQQRAYFSKTSKEEDTSKIYTARKEGHDVAEIQVYLPLKMLYSGLVLVDTPGIGENEFLENYLMEYIKGHQILGFMYIIMTDNALGVAEDRLVNLMSLIVKSQKSNPGVVKFNPKAALFVCNRWDMVQAESKQSVRENVLKQLGKSWPDFDASHAVFFSTYQAQREIKLNKGYVTDEYVALLRGLFKLIDISLDKRIKASYSWIGTVLQRTVHYLKTMERQLDMGDIERQKKTHQVCQKLQVLKGKADGVISSLYEEVEKAVEIISHEVRLFLQFTTSKNRLTKNWGQKQGELPDMDYASGTWVWVKRHIENAFNDRLTDVLEEWDEKNKFILALEKKLFRDAKLQLCELESELLLIENDVQKQEHASLSRSSSTMLLNNLCRSIEDFNEEDYLTETRAPKKLGYRLKQFVTKSFQKKKDDSKLQEYINNPSRVAERRSEKLLNAMLKDKDTRLEGFIKDLLQRPYNYIRRLESKIPGLIHSNMTLLEQFQSDFLAERQFREQYANMMTRTEKVRRDLIEYGESSLYANDFEEKDVTILNCTPQQQTGKRLLTKRVSMGDLMKRSGRSQMSSECPNGIWHTVHPAEIRKGSETQNVMVKIYIPEAIVGQNLQEVAKIRCLLHTDVCIAEMLGVFQQKEAPTAAMIFSGLLISLRQYTKTTKSLDVNTFLQETLAGLQYIHSKGLVHMELSKDTITLSEKGEVKLTGTCLPREPVLPDKKAKISKSNFVCLAPEVLEGEIYKWFADMYAFAILTLEVKNPDFEIFGQENETSIAQLILMATAAKETFQTKIYSLGFSKQIHDKLLSCLNKNVSQRTDALDLAAEFKGRTNLKRHTSVVTPKGIFQRAFTLKR